MLLSTEINLFPDKTVFIQLVIFLGVVLSLNHFVFKPVLKILKLRRLKTEGDRKKIEEVKQKTEILMKEYGSKIQEAKKDAFAFKESLRKEGAEQGQRLIQEARQASSAQIERIKKELEGISQKMRTDLDIQSDVLSQQLAEKIIGRSLKN